MGMMIHLPINLVCKAAVLLPWSLQDVRGIKMRMDAHNPGPKLMTISDEWSKFNVLRYRKIKNNIIANGLEDQRGEFLLESGVNVDTGLSKSLLFEYVSRGNNWRLLNLGPDKRLTPTGPEVPHYVVKFKGPIGTNDLKQDDLIGIVEMWEQKNTLKFKLQENVTRAFKTNYLPMSGVDFINVIAESQRRPGSRTQDNSGFSEEIKTAYSEFASNTRHSQSTLARANHEYAPTEKKLSTWINNKAQKDNVLIGNLLIWPKGNKEVLGMYDKNFYDQFEDKQVSVGIARSVPQVNVQKSEFFESTEFEIGSFSLPDWIRSCQGFVLKPVDAELSRGVGLFFRDMQSGLLSGKWYPGVEPEHAHTARDVNPINDIRAAISKWLVIYRAYYSRWMIEEIVPSNSDVGSIPAELKVYVHGGKALHVYLAPRKQDRHAHAYIPRWKRNTLQKNAADPDAWNYPVTNDFNQCRSVSANCDHEARVRALMEMANLVVPQVAIQAELLAERVNANLMFRADFFFYPKELNSYSSGNLWSALDFPQVQKADEIVSVFNEMQHWYGNTISKIINEEQTELLAKDTIQIIRSLASAIAKPQVRSGDTGANRSNSYRSQSELKYQVHHMWGNDILRYRCYTGPHGTTNFKSSEFTKEKYAYVDLRDLTKRKKLEFVFRGTVTMKDSVSGNEGATWAEHGSEVAHYVVSPANKDTENLRCNTFSIIGYWDGQKTLEEVRV